MNEENGYHNYNGNGNGNGSDKVFGLARVKTPEEIEREKILGTMPELRRNCSRDSRLNKYPGAKWLFGQLTDLTFLRNWGGTGYGIVFISLKDLRRAFGHDEASLSKWRDELVSCGWIWYVNQWPKAQWGICGVSRQPELLPIHSSYVRTMAGGQPKASATPAQNGKTQDFGHNAGNGHTDHRTPSSGPAEGFGSEWPKSSSGPPEGIKRTTRTGHAHYPKPSGHTARSVRP